MNFRIYWKSVSDKKYSQNFEAETETEAVKQWKKLWKTPKRQITKIEVNNG